MYKSVTRQKEIEEKKMKVIDLINSTQKTAFSFEILPPLKGTGIEKLYETIDLLREFASSTPNTSTSPPTAANTSTKSWATDCFSATACAAARVPWP